MTLMRATKISVAASTFACAALLSPGWSGQRSVSLSVESAQARVGHPATPLSAAGVTRRQTRRAVYGAGLAGAAAVGTAGAVAAANAPYYAGAGGPYYGPRPLAAPAAASAPPAGSWDVVRAYYHRGPWQGQGYAYNGWDDYAKRNGIGCKPGTMTKGDNGVQYRCQ
jgi:hypothetical protein